jgi:hypothetical protein
MQINANNVKMMEVTGDIFFYFASKMVLVCGVPGCEQTQPIKPTNPTNQPNQPINQPNQPTISQDAPTTFAFHGTTGLPV